MGFKLKEIEIFPYGGCSKLEYEVNVPIYKELLVLIMGPIIQVIFVYLVSTLNLMVPPYFYSYHYFILLFNLLPIYPLDGGRLLLVLIESFISFYHSYQVILYSSYFLVLIILFSSIFFYFNLLIFIVLILVLFKMCQEIERSNYYFNKFLMERYLNTYCFKRFKRITNTKEMRRGFNHIFLIDNQLLDEKKVLSRLYY